MTRIIDAAVECIDASLNVAQEMSDELDVIEFVRSELSILDEQYGEVDYEDLPDGYMEARAALEYRIMLYVWDHIAGLMTECGAGDIANEVLNNSLFGTDLSWEKNEATPAS